METFYFDHGPLLCTTIRGRNVLGSMVIDPLGRFATRRYIIYIYITYYHAECKGSIRASSEPKRSKIGPEKAELWEIYQREVG